MADMVLDRGSGIGKQILRGFSLMTFEPALLVHLTASFIGNLITTDMQAYQACTVNLEKPAKYCERNATKDDDVLDIISGINIWKQVIDNSFPILYVLFLGAWSDIYGRKFPILMTIFGYIVRYGGLLGAITWDNATAEWIAVISTLPISLTGGRTALSMAIYSYITDTTSLQDRTLRIGIVTAIRTFGKSAGSALGGIMKRRGLSYAFIFGVGGGMDLFAFAYVLFFVRNTRKDNPDRNKKLSLIVKDVCAMRNIKDSAKAFFRKRPGLGRTQLLLLVVTLICTMAPMQGEEGSMQLFVYSSKIGWDTSTYAYYRTYTMLIAFFGGIITLAVFVRLCKINDAVLGVLSCFSQIAGSLLYALADSDTMMYIAPAVDILNGSMIIAARSMISKIAERDEVGKVNSFVGTFDSLTPLPANPIYGAIFDATKDTNAGAMFYLSIGLTIPPLIIFSWFVFNGIESPDDGAFANSVSPKKKADFGKEINESDSSSQGYGSDDAIVKAP